MPRFCRVMVSETCGLDISSAVCICHCHGRGNYLTLNESPIVGCRYVRTEAVKLGRQLFAVLDKVSSPAGSIFFAVGARYVIRGGAIESSATYDSCQVKIFDKDSGAPLRMVDPATLKNN